MFISVGLDVHRRPGEAVPFNRACVGVSHGRITTAPISGSCVVTGARRAQKLRHDPDAPSGTKEPAAMSRRLLCLLALTLLLGGLAACSSEVATSFPGPDAVWIPGHDEGWRWVPGHWA
jgi:hypothetical protein